MVGEELASHAALDEVMCVCPGRRLIKSCPEGTFLGVEGKLGDTDVQISYHCNRLYVTLTLSGVYINRRVLVRRTTYTSTIIP